MMIMFVMKMMITMTLLQHYDWRMIHNDDEDITILQQEVNDVNYRTKCDFGEQSRKENKQC